MKGKGGEIAEILVAGFFFIAALLLVPRILNSIALNNVRVQNSTSPSASANSALARILGSAGDVGVGLVDKWGANLLNLGPDTGDGE